MCFVIEIRITIHRSHKMKTLKEEIRKYYNQLAKEYDHSRFANSYGQYIHYQEENTLNKYLNKNQIALNLDIACGTGRFLEYAHYGIDLSEEMVKVAKSKFPNHKLSVGEATTLPFQNDFFDNVLSFHLMMHLEKQQLKQILAEVHRVTKKEGYFIFDIPSEKRRKLTRYVSPSWHGGNI